MVKFSWHNPEYSAFERWNSLCPSGQYEHVEPTTVSGLIPQSLLDKTHSLVVMASGTGATNVVVANLFRIDKTAIDQQPYIGVWDHESGIATGGFVDHGNWRNRSQSFRQKFFQHVMQSGVHLYLPMLSDNTPAMSGFLIDLAPSPNVDAFWTAIDVKKRKEQE